MNAEFVHRGSARERVCLKTAIPLNTPARIAIDPYGGCNFHCIYCAPQDIESRKAPGGVMDWELFRKVVDGLSEFPDKINFISFGTIAEPLLHPRIVDMIKYAKDSGRINCVGMVTNASLLTHELSRSMVEAGLDRLDLSIQGMNAKKYLEICKYKIDFEKLVDNIAYFYEHRKQCELFIKTIGFLLEEGEELLFKTTFGNIADRLFIENLVNTWPGFEKTKNIAKQGLSMSNEQIKNKKKICTMPFYMLRVEPDGLVGACCADWQRKVIVGDIKNQSIKSIWEGERLKDLQLMFLNDSRKEHPICRTCENPEVSQLDGIDEFQTEILRRFN